MDFLADWMTSWNAGGKTSIIWFVLLAGVVVFLSNKLVQNLDVISEKSHLNASFVGGAFAATITSLPELITEITQAANGTPEIGTADDIGSNVFSMFLIAIAAFIFMKNKFLSKLKGFTRFSFFMSLGAIAFFTLMLLIGQDLVIGKVGTFAVGLVPVIMFLAYTLSLYVGYKYGDEEEIVGDIPERSLRAAWLQFALWALLLVAAAVFLNIAVSSMQHGFQLGSSIAGGLLLAISTSLPEIAVFFILLKNGNTAAAVLALIGSHMFNLGISFIGDLVYYKDAIVTLPKVQENWKLGLMGTLMIGLLTIQVSFPKFFGSNRTYYIIPSLIFIGYIAGTILIRVL